MDICGACGIWAPARSDACAWCAEPLGGKRLRAPDDARLFVAIRLTFTCRGCDLPSPLDAVEPSGTVRCVRKTCGLEQRFDRDLWVQILKEAHAVADLVGPSDEGRSRGAWSIARVNPFRARKRRGPVVRIGSSGRYRDRLPNHLAVELAPGHPLSEQGGRPVRVAEQGAELVTRDGGEAARYGLSAEGRRLYKGLVGVVGDEHRVDRDSRILEAQEGETLSCRSCAGPLPVDGQQRLVRCAFCGATTHVPAPIRHGFERDPKPDTWWMVFQGPSPERGRLERSAPHPRDIEDPPEQKWPLWRRAVDLGLALVLPAVALIVAGALWRLPLIVEALGQLVP